MGFARSRDVPHQLWLLQLFAMDLCLIQIVRNFIFPFASTIQSLHCRITSCIGRTTAKQNQICPTGALWNLLLRESFTCSEFLTLRNVPLRRVKSSDCAGDEGRNSFPQLLHDPSLGRHNASFKVPCYTSAVCSHVFPFSPRSCFTYSFQACPHSHNTCGRICQGLLFARSSTDFSLYFHMTSFNFLHKPVIKVLWS